MNFNGLPVICRFTSKKPLFLFSYCFTSRLHHTYFNNRGLLSLFRILNDPWLRRDCTMPKGKKTALKHTSEKAESCTTKPNPSQSAVTMSKDGNIVISVQVKPGAKQNNITEISEQCVGIQISAPPKEGEANEELVSYLASLLGVKKNAVALERGSKSRQKTVSILASHLTVENVMELLQKEVGNL